MDFDILLDYLPSFGLVVLTGVSVYLVLWLIEKQIDRDKPRTLAKELVLVVGVLVGLLLAIIALPVSETTKENVLKVSGLVLTAVVAFSSTSLIRDGVAGTTLRFFAPYRRGDYLEVDDIFGRISEIGLFHLEIQTVDRSLVTITHSQLLDKPFKTIPLSGTIISVTVEVGYEVPGERVESLLLDAAEETGLENGFVHMLELNDTSITYRVSGLLEPVENLLSLRSQFTSAVVSRLHQGGIELVTPSVQYSRSADDERFVPSVRTDQPGSAAERAATELAERTIFEKALKAKKLEDLNSLLEDLKERRSKLMKESNPKAPEWKVNWLAERMGLIEQRIATVRDDMSD